MSFNFNKSVTQAVFFCLLLVSCNSDSESETSEGSIESSDIIITESSPPISEIITENAQAIQGVSATLEGLDGSIQKNTQAIEKLSADLAIGANSSITSLNTQAFGVNSTSSQATSLLNSEAQAVIDIREISSIPENSIIAATINAQDEDGSSQLKYSLANASGSSDEDFLSIDGETGVITFNSSPNYEDPLDKNKDNTFHFSVIASDGLLSATASYSFSITNVNERPIISSTQIDDIEEGKILVATIAATDPDANTSLTYTLIGTKDSDLFNIGAKTGVITFKTAPDHENPRDSGSNNSINFSVQVSDGVLAAVQEYSFAITNKNEAPVITTTSFSISENNFTVGAISASDVDSGTTLSYGLTEAADSDEQLFSINSTTGALVFKSRPDYENPKDNGSNNIYNITVKVTDGLLVTSKDIEIAVQNINEAPSFL